MTAHTFTPTAIPLGDVYHAAINRTSEHGTYTWRMNEMLRFTDPAAAREYAKDWLASLRRKGVVYT